MTPVPKAFLLAAALAWSGIAAAVFSMRNEPATVMAKAAEFDARWDDATVLKKQDRLPLLARPMPEPNPVELVFDEPTRMPVVMMPPVMMPPVMISHQEEVTKRERHVERNICTRHGMHKVIVRGSRSWRCRRSKSS